MSIQNQFDDIQTKIDFLWDACGHDSALFKELIGNILKLQPLPFFSHLTLSEQEKGAFNTLLDLVDLEVLAQRSGPVVAERQNILEVIRTKASEKLNIPNYEIEFARHHQIEYQFATSDVVSNNAELRAAIHDFKTAMQLNGNALHKNQVDTFTQAINAILKADVSYMPVPGSESHYQKLYALLNDPHTLMAQVAMPLFKEAMFEEAGVLNNVWKAQITVGQVRDVWLKQLAYEAAQVRGSYVLQCDEELINPDSLDASIQGPWQQNICAQLAVGRHLMFRPMLALSATDSTVIRSAIVNGGFNLQQLNEDGSGWTAGSAASELSNKVLVNPYQNCIEQWLWDERAQLLKRCVHNVETEATRVEYLYAHKMPLLWESKGDESEFAAISPELKKKAIEQLPTVQKNFRKHSDGLDVQANDFPTIQNLHFNIEQCPNDLKEATKILNALPADINSPRTRLEKAMNAIYALTENRQQALAIFREVALLRIPDGQLIKPAQTDLFKAYDQLRQLLTPKQIEQGLATVLLQSNDSTQQDITYAAVRDICRLRLAQEVYAKSPDSRFQLVLEYAYAKLVQNKRPFKKFSDLALTIDYDPEMLHRSAPMHRLGQAVTLHQSELQKTATAEVAARRQMVLDAIQDPDRVVFCDNADYLQRLYDCAHQMFGECGLETFATKRVEIEKSMMEAKAEHQEENRQEQERILQQHLQQVSSIEMPVSKHANDYSQEDKQQFEEFKQQFIQQVLMHQNFNNAQEQEQAIKNIEREAELAARRKISETRFLTQLELLKELEHLRAVVVARVNAMQVDQSFISSNMHKTWKSHLNFHSVFSQSWVQEHYAHSLRRHTIENHPAAMPLTARWQYVPNEHKGSKGLFSDSQGQYMKFAYYNPKGVTEWQRHLKIIPWRVTDRYLQETRVRNTGFNTTVTHPLGAQDNMRLIQNKIEHVKITAGKDDLQVILAHVRAAWEIGGFKSVSVVYDLNVPKSLEEYYNKNIPAAYRQQYIEQELATRKEQAELLQKALTELAAGMALDSDGSALDEKQAYSHKFNLTFNGAAISLPASSNEAKPEATFHAPSYADA